MLPVLYQILIKNSMAYDRISKMGSYIEAVSNKNNAYSNDKNKQDFTSMFVKSKSMAVLFDPMKQRDRRKSYNNVQTFVNNKDISVSIFVISHNFSLALIIEGRVTFKTTHQI